MTYRREKLGLAALKPEQETAISNFALNYWQPVLLNCCEESDDFDSQGSLLQMKQGCRAIDRSTHITTNAHKQMNSYLMEANFFFYKS